MILEYRLKRQLGFNNCHCCGPEPYGMQTYPEGTICKTVAWGELSDFIRELYKRARSRAEKGTRILAVRFDDTDRVRFVAAPADVAAIRKGARAFGPKRTTREGSGGRDPGKTRRGKRR